MQVRGRHEEVEGEETYEGKDLHRQGRDTAQVRSNSLVIFRVRKGGPSSSSSRGHLFIKPCRAGRADPSITGLLPTTQPCQLLRLLRIDVFYFLATIGSVAMDEAVFPHCRHETHVFFPLTQGWMEVRLLRTTVFDHSTLVRWKRKGRSSPDGEKGTGTCQTAKGKAETGGRHRGPDHEDRSSPVLILLLRKPPHRVRKSSGTCSRGIPHRRRTLHIRSASSRRGYR